MSDARQEKQRFHQFPLALLAYGDTEQDKINAMVAKATIDAGWHRERTLGGEEKARQYIEKNQIAGTGFKFYIRKHRSWALGLDLVGFTWTESPKPCVEWFDRAESFLATVGKSPSVRVAKKLMEDVYRGEFLFRDFAVLCAVYAVIGDKQYAIVHRDRVRAGALGYSSGKLLFDAEGNITPEGEALLSARADNGRPLTTNQCRHTLNRLHTRKLLSRLQPFKCGRTVYYSRSLDHDALAGRLLGRLEKKLSGESAQDGAQAKFREKAASLLKRLTSGDTKTVTGTDQIVTAGVTGEVTAGVTALIYASPNSCSLNSCSPNSCDPNGTQTAAGVSTFDEEKAKREAAEFKRQSYEAIDQAIANSK